MRTIYRITGFNFRTEAERQIVRGAKVGDYVTLEREPSNPHDANAIRVIMAGACVGYIPAAMARKGLAAHIDANGAPPLDGQTGHTLDGKFAIEGGQPAVEIEEITGAPSVRLTEERSS